jgi:hypothetical protein
MPATNIELVAGEPFSRIIRVTGAAAIWPTTDDFEVRSEARSGPAQQCRLMADLSVYLTPSIDGEDVVVTVTMTGEQTRGLCRTAKNAYYDMFLSDVGPDDARAFKIQYGQVLVDPNITAGEAAS